jgi:hypothetical protein
MAQARIEDLHRAAEARRIQRPEPTPKVDPGPVTLRFAFPDDAEAIARLATLDSSEPPPQPLLLAEVSGQLCVALSLSTGAVVADPFRPTMATVELLRARARQLEGSGPSRRLRRFSIVRRLVPQRDAAL